jgi:two-component system response regulator FlrC
VAPPYQILLAENDRATREVVTAALVDGGHDVVAFGTLDEAVSLLGEQAFDLVLTNDFAIRLADALITTAPLRDAAGDAPVILMTTHPLTLDEVREAGFRGVLVKPFDLASLDEVIADVLGPETAC